MVPWQQLSPRISAETQTSTGTAAA